MPEKWFLEFLGGSLIAYGFLHMVLQFFKRYFPAKPQTCPAEVAIYMKQLSDNQIKMTEILQSLKEYALTTNKTINAIQVDVSVLKDRH